ncbi:hypothetical protein TNCV_2185291 [Trichonephila clavipes]|nr:hypothetical protein TNCV_2185291 [Trichonephila clavipes]
MTIGNTVLFYSAVLRPILSYGCPVWDMLLKKLTHTGNFPFCNSLNNFRAANIEPVHSSPSSNHKAAYQQFQDGLFHHFDFVSKGLIATLSLPVPTTSQVVTSPSRTATSSGTINNYDMGWRLAMRAICPGTDSDNAKCKE